MEKMSYYAERLKMCKFAKSLWDKRLTLATGGNMGMRVDENRVLTTPTRMSEDKHGILEPEDLVLIDYEMHHLEGNGVMTREANIHAYILREMSFVGACIHAHPQYSLVYCAAGKPIPHMTETTKEMGDTPVLPWAEAASEKLALICLDHFKSRETLLKNIGGLCAVMPEHGLVAVGRNIEEAFSIVDRVESDAMVSLFSKLL